MTAKDLKKQSAITTSSFDEPPVQGRENESHGFLNYAGIKK